MADKYACTVGEMLALPVYKLTRGPFMGKDGTVLGELNGYLVCIGLHKTAQGRAAVGLLVRCRKLDNPDTLRNAVEQSSAVAAALESSSLSSSQKKQFAFTADGVQWTGEYSLRKPKAEMLAAVARAICDALKGVAMPLDTHCESCNTRVPEITLFNRVPGYRCAACQEKLRYELDAAGQQYDARDANFGAGLIFGSVAALLGSIAWGTVAYLIHYIFFYGAIGIGYLVGWGVHKGMGKINRAAQALVAVLTVASVLFGDAIFVTLTIMRQEQVGFSLALLNAVLSNFWRIETSDISSLFSVAFALGGAYYALKRFRRPDFKAQFEPLGQAVQMPSGTRAAGTGM
jgi:hypothetical protein